MAMALPGRCKKYVYDAILISMHFIVHDGIRIWMFGTGIMHMSRVALQARVSMAPAILIRGSNGVVLCRNNYHIYLLS